MPDQKPPVVNRAYDVDTFCQAHHISRPFFYKLQRQNQGPKTMKVGRRTLISEEAAAAWRRKMEAESAADIGPTKGAA